MQARKPLLALDESKRTCAICFDTLGSCGPITSTPCAHLFCRQCIVQYVNARQAVDGGHSADAQCPHCRTVFQPKQLIQIGDPEAKAGHSSSSGSSVGSSSNSGGSSSSGGNGGRGGELLASYSPALIPRYSPAFTLSQCDALEPANLEDLHNQNFLQINARLLAHLKHTMGMLPGVLP